MDAIPPVHCNFAVRRPAAGGGAHYEPLYFQTWHGNTFLPLTHPPVVGDLIVLQPDPSPAYETGDLFFRVIERMWTPTQYGSMSWKYGTPMPAEGPALDIIVEPADGLYQDEALEDPDAPGDR